MTSILEQAHRQEKLVDAAVKASGVTGKSEAALWWPLKGYVLDPDGDGRTAPAWERRIRHRTGEEDRRRSVADAGAHSVGRRSEAPQRRFGH